MTDRTYSIAVDDSPAINRPMAARLRALLPQPTPAELWFQKRMAEIKATPNLFRRVTAARQTKGG